MPVHIYVQEQSSNPPRRFDLDWLRVLAVLLLAPFHSALVFNLDPKSIVYLKDTVHSPFLSTAAGFLHFWHMPLLFFISGASTWFALGFRTAGMYARERITRLLIPFIFGLVVFIPPMTYIHYLGQPSGPTFWQHYVSFFTHLGDGTGVDGGFTPAHLWFILYLFIFSLLGLPFFLWLRSAAGRRWIARLGGWLSLPGVVFLLVVPLALSAAPDILGEMNPLYYFSVFLAGYLLISDERIQQAIRRQAFTALALGLGAYAASLALHSIHFPPWTPAWVGINMLYQFARWAWLLAFLGLGQRYLNFTSRALRYLSESSYSFYILHLPVVTIVTWFVIKPHSAIALKYLLIVSLAIVITFALYEIASRIALLRFSLGLKRKI